MVRSPLLRSVRTLACAAVAGAILVSCSGTNVADVPVDITTTTTTTLVAPTTSSTTPALPQVTVVEWAAMLCSKLAPIDTRSRVAGRISTLDPSMVDTTALTTLKGSADSVLAVAAEMDAIAAAVEAANGPKVPNSPELIAAYGAALTAKAASIRSVAVALSNIDPAKPSADEMAKLKAALAGDGGIALNLSEAVSEISRLDPTRQVSGALLGSPTCRKLELISDVVPRAS